MSMWAARVSQDSARDPHRHATGRSSVSHCRIQPNMFRSFSPLIWGRSTGLDNRSIRTARYRFLDIITRWAWMSKSSAESQSRGGSVRDVRMASNNSSPEGSSPPHQNRIRQVSVCVCKMNETFRFLVFSMCGRAWVTPVLRSIVVHYAEDEALSWLPNPPKPSVACTIAM